MGNCSLRAVADATHVPNEEAAVIRIRSASTLRTKAPPPPPGNGVWKVKLLINPKDLEKILSEEVNAEALIQQMRMAANSTPIKENNFSCSSLTHKSVC